MNLRKYIYNNHWTLGFIEEPLKEIVKGQPYDIRWLKNPYKNRWFADPFLLSVDDEVIDVLVEEFYDPINRGRISRLIIDRKTITITGIIPILELETHLSFPAIIRIGEKIFIYPENSALGKLDLYQYDPKTNRCFYAQTLCEQPLTDAILTSVFGERIIFSTHLPEQNGNRLSFYKEEKGLFIEDGIIVFEDNKARNAGDWFKIDDTIYRPAQDCSKRYGGAVIIQKVTKDKDTYLFEDVLRIEDKYADYALGCHTFNYLNDIAVIDVNGYRRPVLANTIKAITGLRMKIKSSNLKWKNEMV